MSHDMSCHVTYISKSKCDDKLIGNKYKKKFANGKVTSRLNDFLQQNHNNSDSK